MAVVDGATIDLCAGSLGVCVNTGIHVLFIITDSSFLLKLLLDLCIVDCNV